MIPPRAILILALLLPALASIGYFITLAGHPLAPLVYGTTKAVMVAIPLLIWWRYGSPPQPRRRGFAWPRQALEGTAIGVVMAAVILVMAYGPLAHLIPQASPHIAAKIHAFSISKPIPYLFAAMVISIVHSAFEEWYWRWFGYGWLRSLMPAWAAHLIAGLAFSLHHMVVTGFYFGWAWGILFGLVVGGASIIWSLLYERQGNLVGAWIAHMCCDVAVMWVGWMAVRSLANG